MLWIATTRHKAHGQKRLRSPIMCFWIAYHQKLIFLGKFLQTSAEWKYKCNIARILLHLSWMCDGAWMVGRKYRRHVVVDVPLNSALVLSLQHIFGCWHIVDHKASFLLETRWFRVARKMVRWSQCYVQPRWSRKVAGKMCYEGYELSQDC